MSKISNSSTIPFTQEFLAAHEITIKFYQKSPRAPFGIRLKGAIRHAIDQALLESGDDQSIASFIEDCIIEKLGGSHGIVTLINRRIEFLNRKEKLKDGLNPVVWSIQEKGEEGYELVAESTSY